MEATLEDLPDDCWEPIVTQLNHHQLESLSLVSRAFFDLTNRLRVSLKVINSSKEVLSKHFQRFPNLKKIDLSSSQGSLQEALHEIAQSQLNIEEINISRKDYPPICLLKEIGSKMKKLKVFRCSYSHLTDEDLTSMAEYFTALEELDISQQYFQAITDEGIVALSKKLKRLQKIDLTGNSKISDHSLIALSTNCKFLRKVVLRHCPGVSEVGISSLMRNSLRYSSLILESTHKYPLSFKNSFKYSKQLSTVEFSNMKISNNILQEIANAKLPLKNFRLSFCTDFTIDGLTSFLKGYQSLKSLALDGTNFLTDECLEYLSQYLGKLISINLNSCFKLTISSFVTITFASKKITCTTATLERVLPLCPNLLALNVTTLVQSHELDIAYIVYYCSHLKHLTINHSEKAIFSEKGDQEFTCELESLSARKSRIDDRLLEVVGTRCPNLLSLDLQDCMSVTERKVRNLVEDCKRIRYIKVDKPLVAWLVASRPSLRQIVVPYTYDKDQVNGFLVQGCVVHRGIWEDWCFYSFDM